jgi:NADPH2:quinone reductase
MQEAIVHPDGTVNTNDAPMPTPGPHEILVKVVIAGTNPKDWMFPQVLGKAHNSGDDLAGTVEAVGSDVRGFHQGDRIAGMHKFPLPHGAFAEYAVLPDYMTFPLPEKVSFEEVCEV